MSCSFHTDFLTTETRSPLRWAHCMLPWPLAALFYLRRNALLNVGFFVFSICSTSVVETVPGPSPLTLPLSGVVNQAAKGHTGHCVCYARRPLLDKTAPLIVPCRFRVHTNWIKYSRLTQELMCWLTVLNEVACPKRVNWISQISSSRIHTGRTQRIC